jgi:hypothetical protein
MRKEDLRDWLGLHKREKKEKDAKETKKQGEKSFCGKVRSIGRRGIGIIVFQVRDRDKGPYLFIEKAIWREDFA